VVGDVTASLCKLEAELERGREIEMGGRKDAAADDEEEEEKEGAPGALEGEGAE
jgi:hypothetical protein